MPLTLKQVQNVCLLYTNDYTKCRYLAQDETNSHIWVCLKQSSKKKEIDEEVKDLLADLNKKGTDPLKYNAPLGDNCGGFPILRHIQQGIT